MQTDQIKTPWYAFYEGVRAHLEYPQELSLYEYMERRTERFSDNISYDYFGRKATYAHLHREIETCANAFLQLGVKRGDRVSICMPNTPEAVISFYALNKIGAVANMIHPLSAAVEIRHYVTVSESEYIVAVDLCFPKIHEIMRETGLKRCILVSVADSMPIHMKLGYYLTNGANAKPKNPVPGHMSGCISWKKFRALGKKGGRESGGTERRSKGDDVAAILYSGGTTGYPKGIELTNLNFNALAMQGEEMCACLRPGDRLLAIMPVFHGFGLGICIHTALCAGCMDILLPRFDAGHFDRLLRRHKPNIIAGVPTLYEALLESERLAGYDLSFLKCVISGGDSLSAALKQKVDQFLRQHGTDAQVREGYGLTECVTGSCLTPLHGYREGSIGIPYPDTYYKIVKPQTDTEMPYGEEGEIVLNGPTVMKGYLNDGEETDKVLRKHGDGRIWLHTGDLGVMDSDGFVYFRQRLKRLIISSGYCLYPQYIENVIDSHKDVLVSCVVGIGHPYKVQVAKAYIVLKDNVEDVQKRKELLQDIRRHCEKNLAKYSWPYTYEVIDELPRTLVGKVAYNELTKEDRSDGTA
ncbi:MAG: AMP-binding protein [Lachnospiraceae bacterium]|nr:AMP-binding protein [Lachnospiraceae bacterium]